MLKKAVSLALLLALVRYGGGSSLEGDDQEEVPEEDDQDDQEQDQGPDEGSLLNEGDLKKHNIKAMWGNKVGSIWLTVNGDSILVKRKTTLEGKVW